MKYLRFLKYSIHFGQLIHCQGLRLILIREYICTRKNGLGVQNILSILKSYFKVFHQAPSPSSLQWKLLKYKNIVLIQYSFALNFINEEEGMVLETLNERNRFW